MPPQWFPPQPLAPQQLPPQQEPPIWPLPQEPLHHEPLPQRIPPKRFNPQPVMFPPEQVHPTRIISHPQNSGFRPFQQRKLQDEVVFISSSMFAELDALKLSTNKVKSHVFSYPGADSQRMVQKLESDRKIKNIVKNAVSKVFLLTGTNNVDPICNQRQTLQNSCNSITKTIDYVQSLFPSAIVNVINILPRVHENRKIVITQLNSHIKKCCERKPHNLCYIDTYSIKLFTFPNGVRKTELFKYMSRNDFDNVHLNNYGVIKLGKHLKYLAHL